MRSNPTTQHLQSKVAVTIFLGLAVFLTAWPITACQAQRLPVQSTLTQIPVAALTTPTTLPSPTPSTIPLDSDNDGWLDAEDLCPFEAAPQDSLAGCAPLGPTQYDISAPYQYRYSLPMDPSGQIQVAGERLLLLTDYQQNLVLIYDLADGRLLRSLSIPDLINDTPRLLPQGLILQNYDLRRWRLLDLNGNLRFRADEELEIIQSEKKRLISRTENTILLRTLDHPAEILAELPGMYVSLDSSGNRLAVTDLQRCSLSVYELPDAALVFQLDLPVESEDCRQAARFSRDGRALIQSNSLRTTRYDLEKNAPPEEFAGQLLAELSTGLLLRQDQQLVLIQPDQTRKRLIDLGDLNFRGLSIGPDEQWLAVQSMNLSRQPASQITFYTLPQGLEIRQVNADHIQNLRDQILLWQIGSPQIMLLDAVSLQPVYGEILQPMLHLQTALGGGYLLLSGEDQHLHVYGAVFHPSGDKP